MNRNLKLLIVDDSAFIRKILTNIFSADEDFIKIDTAQNGKSALELVAKNDYDVITLDVEMPILNGIETLKKIMEMKKTPVVMLSSLTTEGADITLDALEYGAVDFIEKPQNIFTVQGERLANEIKDKVKAAARVNVMSYMRHQNATLDRITSNEVETKKQTLFQKTASGDIVKKIIAIGTSTGGPRALHEVIPSIKGNINAPVLIVQHMPKGFTKSLAERLDSFSSLSVKEAEDGELLKNGVAYVAPGGLQMKITSVDKDKFKINLENSAPVNGHKPSVDAMMESVSQSKVDEVVAVIMTGMGGDGANGLAKLKDVKRAVTIAEDESTCVVFGMPKVAIQTGKVDKVLPLREISREINKIMGV
nr:chemotaxis response regulator protein-glutamate methylesterase [uncultured Criibacterium sp.]